MKIFAVVPVKQLSNSKSRLASMLTPENRKKFTLTMLKDVLTAIKGSEIRDIVVVGKDRCVCEVAMAFGAFYIEEKRRGLNRAVEDSIKWCVKEGANSVLVLPADIPLLTSLDINRIIRKAGELERVVVLSPSENGGTNALYLKPPNLIAVSYGLGSFRRHLKFARSKSICAKVFLSASVALDIDAQNDLQKLLETSSMSFSTQLVREILKE